MRYLPIVLALSLSGCFGACEDHRTPAQKKQDQVIPLMFRQRLVKIAAVRPDPAALVEKRCPAFSQDASPALAFDLSTVGYYTDPKWDADAGDRPMLAFIDAPELWEGLGAGSTMAFSSQLFDVRERWYALIVSRERRPPALDGKTFVPGVLDGWVVFFDKEGAGPLCQAPFHAESSHEVHYDEKGFGPPKRRALCEDFAERADAAINGAAARIGGPKVALGGQGRCFFLKDEQ